MTGAIAPLKAIESLRCGVPNADAVRILGTNQADIVRRFEATLVGDDAPGFLVQGGFGSGKSHVLACQREAALSRGFAVSVIALGKDVTLGDIPKFFCAAIRELALPGRRVGGGCAEIVDEIDTDAQAFRNLAAAYEMDDFGHKIFGATIRLFERSRDVSEAMAEVFQFWDGLPCRMGAIRQYMRHAGLETAGLVAPSNAAIAWQRFDFVNNLIIGAGYSGWVLLIDEAEMIAKVSRLARAKSYANLARLLGASTIQSSPGVRGVAAITDDLWIELLGARADQQAIPAQFGARHPTLVSEALSALDFLTSTQVTMPIRAASPEERAHLVSRVRAVYRIAYGADEARADAALDGGALRNTRELVKRTVAQADLARLYPGHAIQLTAEHVASDLAEDDDYESMEAS